MPKTKDLKLDKFDIGQALYRELLWFCLQYKEKKSKLQSCYGLSAVSYKHTPMRTAKIDTTAKTAEMAERYRADIDLINIAAKTACPCQTQLFLQTITDQQTTYTTIRMKGFKMSQGEFNKTRRNFFYLLAIRMKKI